MFVAGAFQEPKDIPETVTQASAAASMSMELLASARNTLITKKSYPDGARRGAMTNRGSASSSAIAG